MAGARKVARKIVNLPNAITLFRLSLAAPFTYFLLKENTTYAIAAFFAFLALDILDGYMARRLGQATRFGKNFDYFTDIAFSLIIFFVQVFRGKVHPIIWSAALANFLVVAIIMAFRKKNISRAHVKRAGRRAGILSYYSFIFILLFDFYNQMIFSIVTMLLASMYYTAYRYYADY